MSDTYVLYFDGKEKHSPSPFLPGTKIQFAFDSTSLGWLKTCPRLYEYQMIEGWRAKGTGVHLKFGQLYHSALELYDKLRSGAWDSHYNSEAKAFNHEEALYAVVRDALESTWDRIPGEFPEGDYECYDEKLGHMVPKIGNGKAWTSDHPAKNRETLIRSVIWYLDNFKDDPAATLILANGKPAVELSFRMELDWGPKRAYKGGELEWTDEGDREAANGKKFKVIREPGYSQPYILSGHLDRVVEFGGQKYVMDRKTTGSSPTLHYFDGFAPDNQMCQPSGTFVLTSSGETPIESVKVGDEVLVPSRTHHNLRKMRVLATADRGYSGDLFVLKTKLHEHKVTPNHRCVVRIRKEASNREAVYLMRKGNQYRIGITSLRTRRDFKNGLSQRCRGEYADAMWLLATTSDREEAWAIEQILSLRYGIPAFTFLNKSLKDFSPTKQHQLDWLWLQIGDNTSNAKKLLDTFDQDLQYPIYETKGDEHSELSIDRKSFIRACNLQHDIFEVYIHHNGVFEWVPLIVNRESFEGTVFSLEIDKDAGTYNRGIYISNGILTGNSIYTLAARVQFSTPVAGVIIDAAQIAVGFTRFQRGFTYRTEAQLEEWLSDARYWFAQAESFAEAGYWPTNDRSCSMYGGCTFRKICSKSPEVRERFLESDFERKPWNPLASRG